MEREDQPAANGLCWCDCGGNPRPGQYFLPGHERTAERYLSAIDSASTLVQRLARRGFVPGQGSLRAGLLATAAGYYEECGMIGADGRPCRVVGRGQGMDEHRAGSKHGAGSKPRAHA
jgi:hypothetical protein